MATRLISPLVPRGDRGPPRRFGDQGLEVRGGMGAVIATTIAVIVRSTGIGVGVVMVVRLRLLPDCQAIREEKKTLHKSEIF